jgi:type IV pilus assembly protein PilN
MLFFLNVAIFGWWYWSLKSQRAEKNQKREKLQAEVVRLQKIQDKIKDYEKQKKDLQERIDIIEKLKESQVGPVALLAKVKSSVPEQLWLTALSQAGGTITVEGNFLRDESLPVFIANLQNTKHFGAVDLNFYEKEKDSERGKFSLKCQLALKR